MSNKGKSSTESSVSVSSEPDSSPKFVQMSHYDLWKSDLNSENLRERITILRQKVYDLGGYVSVEKFRDFLQELGIPHHNFGSEFLRISGFVENIGGGYRLKIDIYSENEFGVLVSKPEADNSSVESDTKCDADSVQCEDSDEELDADEGEPSYEELIDRAKLDILQIFNQKGFVTEDEVWDCIRSNSLDPEDEKLFARIISECELEFGYMELVVKVNYYYRPPFDHSSDMPDPDDVSF